MPKPVIKLLVTDLDNTLYDWVGFFAKAFRAMVEVAVPILGVDREALLDHRRDQVVVTLLDQCLSLGRDEPAIELFRSGESVDGDPAVRVARRRGLGLAAEVTVERLGCGADARVPLAKRRLVTCSDAPGDHDGGGVFIHAPILPHHVALGRAP